MQILFPVLEKAPVLLPACWVIRWVKTVFKIGTIKREMNVMGQIDGDKAKALQDFHKRAGLKDTYDS